MLRLYLLRHVSASYPTSGQRDIERKISNIGLKGIDKIKSTIGTYSYFPDFIYCSPATRTQQTLDGIKDSFSNNPEILIADHLYSCEASDYQSTIAEHSIAEALMIIGHNPMCCELAHRLCARGNPENLQKIARGYSEGGMAILDFAIDKWSQLKPDSGYLSDFHEHRI